MDDQHATLSVLAALLAESFADDPGMSYLCQSSHGGYKSRLTGWFLAMLRMHSANEQPIMSQIVSGEIVACAVLTLPGANLGVATLVRWLWDCARLGGLRSLWRTLRHVRRASQHHPAEPHFRLEFIAVAPSQQGKGYGRDLLMRIHERVDSSASSKCIWLETANADNVPFYERFGYVAATQLPIGNQAESVVMIRRA